MGIAPTPPPNQLPGSLSFPSQRDEGALSSASGELSAIKEKLETDYSSLSTPSRFKKILRRIGLGSASLEENALKEAIEHCKSLITKSEDGNLSRSDLKTIEDIQRLASFSLKTSMGSDASYQIARKETLSIGLSWKDERAKQHLEMIRDSYTCMLQATTAIKSTILESTHAEDRESGALDAKKLAAYAEVNSQEMTFLEVFSPLSNAELLDTKNQPAGELSKLASSLHAAIKSDGFNSLPKESKIEHLQRYIHTNQVLSSKLQSEIEAKKEAGEPFDELEAKVESLQKEREQVTALFIASPKSNPELFNHDEILGKAKELFKETQSDLFYGVNSHERIKKLRSTMSLLNVYFQNVNLSEMSFDKKKELIVAIKPMYQKLAEDLGTTLSRSAEEDHTPKSILGSLACMDAILPITLYQDVGEEAAEEFKQLHLDFSDRYQYNDATLNAEILEADASRNAVQTMVDHADDATVSDRLPEIGEGFLTEAASQGATSLFAKEGLGLQIGRILYQGAAFQAFYLPLAQAKKLLVELETHQMQHGFDEKVDAHIKEIRNWIDAQDVIQGDAVKEYSLLIGSSIGSISDSYNYVHYILNLDKVTRGVASVFSLIYKSKVYLDSNRNAKILEQWSNKLDMGMFNVDIPYQREQVFDKSDPLLDPRTTSLPENGINRKLIEHLIDEDNPKPQSMLEFLVHHKVICKGDTNKKIGAILRKVKKMEPNTLISVGTYNKGGIYLSKKLTTDGRYEVSLSYKPKELVTSEHKVVLNSNMEEFLSGAQNEETTEIKKFFELNGIENIDLDKLRQAKVNKPFVYDAEKHPGLKIAFRKEKGSPKTNIVISKKLSALDAWMEEKQRVASEKVNRYLALRQSEERQLESTAKTDYSAFLEKDLENLDPEKINFDQARRLLKVKGIDLEYVNKRILEGKYEGARSQIRLYKHFSEDDSYFSSGIVSNLTDAIYNLNPLTDEDEARASLSPEDRIKNALDALDAYINAFELPDTIKQDYLKAIEKVHAKTATPFEVQAEISSVHLAALKFIDAKKPQEDQIFPKLKLIAENASKHSTIPKDIEVLLEETGLSMSDNPDQRVALIESFRLLRSSPVAGKSWEDISPITDLASLREAKDIVTESWAKHNSTLSSVVRNSLRSLMATKQKTESSFSKFFTRTNLAGIGVSLLSLSAATLKIVGISAGLALTLTGYGAVAGGVVLLGMGLYYLYKKKPNLFKLSITGKQFVSDMKIFMASFAYYDLSQQEFKEQTLTLKISRLKDELSNLKAMRSVQSSDILRDKLEKSITKTEKEIGKSQTDLVKVQRKIYDLRIKTKAKKRALRGLRRDIEKATDRDYMHLLSISTGAPPANFEKRLDKLSSIGLHVSERAKQVEPLSHQIDQLYKEREYLRVESSHIDNEMFATRQVMEVIGNIQVKLSEPQSAKEYKKAVKQSRVLTTKKLKPLYSELKKLRKNKALSLEEKALHQAFINRKIEILGDLLAKIRESEIRALNLTRNSNIDHLQGPDIEMLGGYIATHDKFLRDSKDKVDDYAIKIEASRESIDSLSKQLADLRRADKDELQVQTRSINKAIFGIEDKDTIELTPPETLSRSDLEEILKTLPGDSEISKLEEDLKKAQKEHKTLQSQVKEDEYSHTLNASITTIEEKISRLESQIKALSPISETKKDLVSRLSKSFPKWNRDKKFEVKWDYLMGRLDDEGAKQLMFRGLYSRRIGLFFEDLGAKREDVSLTVTLPSIVASGVFNKQIDKSTVDALSRMGVTTEVPKTDWKAVIINRYIISRIMLELSEEDKIIFNQFVLHKDGERAFDPDHDSEVHLDLTFAKSKLTKGILTAIEKSQYEEQVRDELRFFRIQNWNETANMGRRDLAYDK